MSRKTEEIGDLLDDIEHLVAKRIRTDLRSKDLAVQRAAVGHAMRLLHQNGRALRLKPEGLQPKGGKKHRPRVKPVPFPRGTDKKEGKSA